ncbi:glycosyltransferase family 4 protein [Flectobacillus major]|uniref:glycosyltransferase family 4 protein n=1 Tax=Flectobacillus major TaxID=103 RepID=UPI000420B581|nr:glycosyltransferase family 4 protein [Flectobacillus major]
MSNLTSPHLFLVVNVDWFFLSHRLAIALATLHQGYRVTIVTRDTGHRSTIESYGFTMIDLPMKRSGKNLWEELKVIYFLWKTYQQNHPDLIHHVGIKLILWGSIANFWAKKAPVINAVSGLGSSLSSKKWSFEKILLRLLQTLLRASNHHFVFQNNNDATFFQKNIRLAISQFTIIKGVGVDTTYYQETPELFTPLQVVLIARMIRDKGIDEFIRAALLLQPKWQYQACFSLIGGLDPDSPSAYLEEELQQNLIPDYLNWLGFQADVREHLEQANIVVLPSYHEGLPKVLLEASAVGRAIVASDCAGCTALIQHGINGILVPIGDASQLAQQIHNLLENTELRLALGKAARLKVEQEFSQEIICQQFLMLYQAMLLGK